MPIQVRLPRLHGHTRCTPSVGRARTRASLAWLARGRQREERASGGGGLPSLCPPARRPALGASGVLSLCPGVDSSPRQTRCGWLKPSALPGRGVRRARKRATRSSDRPAALLAGVLRRAWGVALALACMQACEVSACAAPGTEWAPSLAPGMECGAFLARDASRRRLFSLTPLSLSLLSFNRASTSSTSTRSSAATCRRRRSRSRPCSA